MLTCTWDDASSCQRKQKLPESGLVCSFLNTGSKGNMKWRIICHGGSILYFARCTVISLSCPITIIWSHHNQKCLQKLPNVPKGRNVHDLRLLHWQSTARIHLTNHKSKIWKYFLMLCNFVRIKCKRIYSSTNLSWTYKVQQDYKNINRQKKYNC